MMKTALKNSRLRLLALAIMAALAVPGFAQGQSTPGVPGNLNITVGDTEAKIAWAAPVAGDCAATDYDVQVSHGHSGALIRESQSMTVTEWTLDGLTANTNYQAAVTAYGESCDAYSNAAEQDFTTNASSSLSDPVRGPNEAKYIPAPPRNLVITVGDTEATIAWTAPVPDADTCAATEYYVRVFHWHSGELVRESQIMTATQWTLDGLTANTNYQAAVIAYSDSGSCAGESSQPANQDFTTNASSNTNDPVRGASEAQYVQAPPSGVAITRQGTSDDIRVSWTPSPSSPNTCSPTYYSVRLHKDGTRVGKADEVSGTHRDFEGVYTAAARYTAKIESYSAGCDEWSDRARLSTTLP